MKNVKVTLYSAGYCSQWERMVLRGGRCQTMKFPAICAFMEHPVQGNILFDTGYSHHVLAEAKKFPMQLYQFITPIKFEEKNSIFKQLQGKKVFKIFLSHFHIDHMGGLLDFPEALFLTSKEAYQSILGLNRWSCLKAAFMPGLLPKDFLERTQFIEDLPRISLPYAEFDWGYDLFKDGSMIAIPLPGHAVGQMGLLVSKRFFLVADACWTSQSYRENRLPSLLARMAIADYAEFKSTLAKLHRFHQQYPEIKIIPTHCMEVLCSQY